MIFLFLRIKITKHSPNVTQYIVHHSPPPPWKVYIVIEIYRNLLKPGIYLHFQSDWRLRIIRSDNFRMKVISSEVISIPIFQSDWIYLDWGTLLKERLFLDKKTKCLHAIVYGHFVIIFILKGLKSPCLLDTVIRY